MAKKVNPVPKRSQLIDHIEQLQSQILLFSARPVTLNTGYAKPRCSHGHEMEIVAPRSCPSCVKPGLSVQDQLAEKDATILRWQSANGDKDAEIVKLRAIIEYLEEKANG